jgi:hypothetical protein
MKTKIDVQKVAGSSPVRPTKTDPVTFIQDFEWHLAVEEGTICRFQLKT